MVLIVIPARLASTRLPAKPLADLGGHPLLWWTWRKACASRHADRVVIATDSDEIVDAMQAYGAECLLTSDACCSGTDRVFEASQQLSEQLSGNDDLIVNVQGDEPFLPVGLLDGSIECLQQDKAADFEMATAAIPFPEGVALDDCHQVKVVYNQQGRALYFSRAALAHAKMHVGIYAFRASALQRFCSLPPSPLEEAERLEQLRALEDGFKIALYHPQDLPTVSRFHFGIDTPADLDRARRLLQSHPELHLSS